MATLPTEMLQRLPEPFSRRVLSRYVRVFTGTSCVQECVSCPFPTQLEKSFKPREEVQSSIDRAVTRGASGVIFAGGEPALHPDIHPLMIHARSQNLAVALVSNGVLLAEKDILDGMYAAGLSRVHVHIFSHDVDKHRSMAGGDADLNATMEAVRRMVTDLIYVVAVLPLMRANVQDLPDILNMLTEAGVRKIHFTTPMSLKDPDEALDPVILGAVLDAVIGDNRFSSITYDRIPLCVSRFHLPYYAQTRHRDPLVRDFSSDSLAWPCAGCQAVDDCDGRVSRGASQQWLRQLAPFQNPVSNSFNYALDRFLGDAKSLTDCPIREGEIKLPKMDAERDVLLYYRDRLITVTTHTSDFSDRQLRLVREDLGQLYLDVSEKVLLDDFEKDLVPLRRASDCVDCSNRGACPGAFEAKSLTTGFRDSEEQVLSIMNQLEGRVLDVGVGEPHSLRKCIDEETGVLPFEYVGIEPDPQRLDEVQKELPELTFYGGAAEDGDLYARFVENQRPFDHVVLLRSYNHLTDLVVAFDNLMSVLKPGGTILLVENTVFGLARGRKKLALLGQMERSGKAPFEHYRNHTSHEAQRVLEGFGLEVLAHHAVGPETANQWVLWLKKPEIQND